MIKPQPTFPRRSHQGRVRTDATPWLTECGQPRLGGAEDRGAPRPGASTRPYVLVKSTARGWKMHPRGSNITLWCHNATWPLSRCVEASPRRFIARDQAGTHRLHKILQTPPRRGIRSSSGFADLIQIVESILRAPRELSRVDAARPNGSLQGGHR